jgi:hypothetical protein
MVISLPGVAGTLIESRDDVGGSSTVKIETTHVRIESGDDSGYMLIDMKNNKVYSVSNDDHMVIDASTPVDMGPADTEQTDVPHTAPTITKIGKGPRIAGYSTVHYKVSVGDQHCYDEYLASKPLENKDVKNFTAMMSKWSSEQRKYAGGMYEDEDECDAAESVVTDQYTKLGIPMRTVDSAGTVIHEITRIQTGVSFPSSVFTPPKEYPVVTQQELMKRLQGSPGGDTQVDDPDQLEEMQQNIQEMFDRMQQQE